MVVPLYYGLKNTFIVAGRSKETPPSFKGCKTFPEPSMLEKTPARVNDLGVSALLAA